MEKVPDAKEKRFFIEWSQNWRELISPKEYNWIEIDLIKIRFENTRYFGYCEFELKLLGAGMSVAWIYDTKQNEAQHEKLECEEL